MTSGYDVVIIGAGPAGLTAGIYCGRAGLKTLVLEKGAAGGQILKAEIVENYPAFPDGISGFELMEKIRRQAERFGAKFAMEEAAAITAGRTLQDEFCVKTAAGGDYCARAVIVATGANPKKLGIKGEEELAGMGVSYCATCDGPLFKGRDIVVVGGGDAAIGEALYLARFAKRLTLVHRRPELRAAKVLRDKALNAINIEMKLGYVASEITGAEKVRGIKIMNVKTGKEEELSASGVFIYVGVSANTEFLKGSIESDEKGFIVADETMHTSLKGVFACGDARKNALKQVVTACSEGAVAAYSCAHYLEEKLG